MTHTTYAVPPVMPPASERGDVTGGIIPYKNARALTAYYCGIFGLLPGVGFPLAIIACVMGVLGRKAFQRTPIIRGEVHSWVGILLGGFSVAYHLLVIAAIVVALLGKK